MIGLIHYDDDEGSLQKLFAAVDQDLLARGRLDDESLTDDEQERFMSDSHVVYCSTFISVLRHPNFRVGKKAETLLDCLHAHGFRLSVIHEMLMQYTLNSYDMRLTGYVVKRERVQEVAQQLTNAAEGLRFLKGLHLPYRETRAGEELIGELDRFAAAEIPRQWLTRDLHPDSYHEFLALLAEARGGSELTPTVGFRSPLRFPAELMELFHTTPPRRSGRSQSAKLWNAHIDAAVERLEKKRGFDRERRVEAAPMDVENIATLIDDLAEEVARAARLLKRPMGRRVKHAQRSFRRTFAAHSQVITGNYHDEICAALYSMTFHQHISVSDYRRLRQLDSSEAKKPPSKS